MFIKNILKNIESKKVYELADKLQDGMFDQEYYVQLAQKRPIKVNSLKIVKGMKNRNDQVIINIKAPFKDKTLLQQYFAGWTNLDIDTDVQWVTKN